MAQRQQIIRTAALTLLLLILAIALTITIVYPSHREVNDYDTVQGVGEVVGKRACTWLRKHIMSIEKKRNLEKLFELLTP